MTRTERFENARFAVATALLTGATYTEAELLTIARAELTDRSAFLAKPAVNACIQDDAGTIGEDIMITMDDAGEVFSFRLLTA